MRRPLWWTHKVHYIVSSQYCWPACCTRCTRRTTFFVLKIVFENKHTFLDKCSRRLDPPRISIPRKSASTTLLLRRSATAAARDLHITCIQQAATHRFCGLRAQRRRAAGKPQQVFLSATCCNTAEATRPSSTPEYEEIYQDTRQEKKRCMYVPSTHTHTHGAVPDR